MSTNYPGRDTTSATAIRSGGCWTRRRPMKPTLSQIVHYRGKYGYQAMRAAIVTADVRSLDPRGVKAGDIPALDSDMHVHLWVFTPGEAGGFTEYNVPCGEPFESQPGQELPPGTWGWPPRA